MDHKVKAWLRKIATWVLKWVRPNYPRRKSKIGKDEMWVFDNNTKCLSFGKDQRGGCGAPIRVKGIL